MFHILLVINLEITTLLLDLSRLLLIWSFTFFPEKKNLQSFYFIISNYYPLNLHLFSILLGIYLGIELLGHMVTLCLAL